MSDNTIWITRNILPQPWDLGPPWFDRLELSEEHRRRYSHLSPREIQFIESARLVAEQYTLSGILQDGKSTTGLVRRLANELDKHWLKPSYGRAVDIKTVLEVLERHAEYCAWVKSFTYSALIPILEIDIPYWMNPHGSIQMDPHYGPGILSVEVHVQHPSFGKRGQVYWRDVQIELRERNITRDWAKEELVDPVLMLSPEGNRNHKTGLLNWVLTSINDAINEHIPMQRRFGFKTTSKPGIRTHLLSDPSIDDIELILDLVSMYAHQQCFPVSPKHQLVYDVSEDLSKIGVRKIETERWLRRDELPPLVPALTT